MATHESDMATHDADMATHDSAERLTRVLTPIQEQDGSDASLTSTEDVQNTTETGKATSPTAADDTENDITEDGITGDGVTGDDVTDDGNSDDAITDNGTIEGAIKDAITADGIQDTDEEIRDVTHDVVVSFHVDSDVTFQVTTADVLTKFEVSACSVTTASPVWRNMLYGKTAGRPASGDWIVEIEGDLKALDILFRIIHYQFSKVPTTLPIDELFELMLLTDRFKCTHLVFPWARKWASAFAAYACEKDHFYHCHKVAFIAWELGTEKLFCDMVYAMIISSKVDAAGDLVNVSAIPLKDMILPTGILG